MQETVLLCKPCPMQRLLVQCVSTSARWTYCNDGLRSAATQIVDKLSHTTEPGLQAYSFYFFMKEEQILSKKKVAAILGSVAVLVIVVLAGLYIFFIKLGDSRTDFEKIRLGMKAWDNLSVPGISIYVPDDYIRTENEFYSSYTKDGATVSLTSEEVDNDLANYAYYAVRQYENITDSFTVKEEFDETLHSETVHVVEFDYTLSLDSGVRSFSCLSAYMMGNGRSYILTCVSDTDEFPLFREDFHRIYKTMALTEE